MRTSIQTIARETTISDSCSDLSAGKGHVIRKCERFSARGRRGVATRGRRSRGSLAVGSISERPYKLGTRLRRGKRYFIHEYGMRCKSAEAGCGGWCVQHGVVVAWAGRSVIKLISARRTRALQQRTLHATPTLLITASIFLL